MPYTLLHTATHLKYSNANNVSGHNSVATNIFIFKNYYIIEYWQADKRNAAAAHTTQRQPAHKRCYNLQFASAMRLLFMVYNYSFCCWLFVVAAR